MLVFATLAITLLCGLLLSVPRSRRVRAHLVRLLALAGGGATPLLLTWWTPSGAGDVVRWALAITLSLITGPCAVTLVANGWRAVARLGRRWCGRGICTLTGVT